MFGALMGDFEDDPFMGGQMRRMNSMMNSFFTDPFGGMMGGGMALMPFAGAPQPPRRNLARYDGGRDDFGMGLMPMGFPNMRSLFQDMTNNGNCHSFSSSTVMTMTQGPDGRPQVYQASTSTRQAPGGIRETKKTVADSRTGLKKMAIGHHIGERAHVIEREHNVYSGDKEERQEFINLDEDEAEDFNREWEVKTRNYARGRHQAIGQGSRGPHHHQREPQLALPPSTGHSSAGHPSSKRLPPKKKKSDGSKSKGLKKR